MMMTRPALLLLDRAMAMMVVTLVSRMSRPMQGVALAGQVAEVAEVGPLASSLS